MDKKAIKTFAIESRKKLIEEVKYQASLLGITAKGIAEPVEKAEGIEVYDIGASNPNTIYDEAIKQRKNLVKRINEKGFDNVVEEVAYTWFNRIIAIRFMEVNDYLPTRVRVLSSETEGKIEPDIVTEASHIDLDFTEEEIEQIYLLKNNNKLDELFRLLFIKQCNKLNEILPELFEKTTDYTELLLSISFTNEEGVVRQLIDNISEEDFNDQVEVIGWLYQYYNTELKDDTFKQLKKRVKISKERIPAVTQLFTPDWIVRYMVENSLGRLWLEYHPDSNLKDNWIYYLEEAEQEPEVQIELAKIREESKNLKPEDIKVIDPAMGSGHILIYAFDVLMQIYTSAGYSDKDAAESILKNNLYGLDIDDRAYQLAYFAVMMKGRSFNRKIFTKNVEPQICAIQESNKITDELINFVADGDLNIQKDLRYLVETFKDAKEYGSIIDVNQLNFNYILNRVNEIKTDYGADLKTMKLKESVINILLPILKQSEIFANNYDIVITNPPYMGKNGMDKNLIDYLKLNYPKTKSDLSTVFIEKTLNMCKNGGYMSMINIPVWMFLSSYEDLREIIIKFKTFINMLHFGRGIFGSDFGTTSFIIKNQYINGYKATYRQLFEKKSAVDSIKQKKSWFFEERDDKYIINQNNFLKIPGNPIAYRANENLLDAFVNGKELSTLADAKQGLATADNNRFLRFWYELDIFKCGFDFKDPISAKNSQMKWFPYNKGGDFRKWYGNQEYMVNWENDGFEIKNIYDKKGKLRSRPQNTQFYFLESLSWSKVTIGTIAFRYYSYGFLFDVAGCSIFLKQNKYYLLGFLNSKVCEEILSFVSPTVNYEVGHISALPLIQSVEEEESIIKIVKENINIAKEDWDSFETSWNFNIHPLLTFDRHHIERAFNEWKSFKQDIFSKLKSNEININKSFIDIYNVNGDISPDVEDKYVTLNKADLLKDVKNFISYSVGCMLGRFSLDEQGIIYAGGQWDPLKYTIFVPDDDNIIPILDTEYFEDDIVGQFVEFVKVTFGEETLEENLDFIAQALKNKGTTSREVIRNYFLTDFYKDHVKTYKKHPIYWLFDSGRDNGFKALIYMHRYEPDLVARIRTDYLHKTQKALETTIAHNDRIIETSTSASEKSKAVKAKNKLVKQLEETKKYDEALAHIANQKIEIDLDDGVKVNYAKFQGVEVSKEGKKITKIDLLKKL
ncbi:restriction endonuclease [Methanobacterium subterraneum]|uniref:site-specific DNA-methyltransferase (adenine-specific) n=1 Tax=Methanobacterium subterraneum TaxID=59277 RepID=A0A2H4VNZ4_9EURY|nr:BREX-1 system adenine-specific DNA-methyltransferase PglX [Methanobacterium subterraneum]AUB59809.1 restriction endonuclease [Methanobacterium subterraneum]